MGLEDGDDNVPAPAATSESKPAPTAPKAQSTSVTTNTERNIPGSGRGGNRGRGNYPSRGGPRNTYREGGQGRNGPTAEEGVAEGMETPGGFDGERVREFMRNLVLRE
jgi:plasminogen activator inhibitor 1 RNA-binding protein